MKLSNRTVQIDEALVERLYREAKAERWHLPVSYFARALEASAARAFADRAPKPRELERYLASLHLEDLALACACAAGEDAAWEHFMHEQRPVLYRAADALDPTGSARDLADALYADLYGLQHRRADVPERQSLFRYFHGRSSLATWLRAVLAQRHVDLRRAYRRTESLPDELSPAFAAPASVPPDPDRTRYLALIQRALGRALDRLGARDRLRLGCYYVQGLTLAQTGRLLREHEATVSRHLAYTRRTIRKDVERQLRAEARLSDAEITVCFEYVLEDVGALDLGEMLAGGDECKEPEPNRSL